MVTFRRTPIFLLVVSALICIGASAAAADDEQRGRGRAAAASGDAPAGWDLSLTGGFGAMGLVDPVYALGSITGQPVRVVLRQPDQESTVNLGGAMFAPVFHDGYPWVCTL